MKANADFMFQTDIDGSGNPTSFSIASNKKIQPKKLNISPKSFKLKLNYESNSSYSFRTPKAICKKLKSGEHSHGNKTEKPLEKTFLNPIIPKYGSFHKNSSKISKFPNIKINMQALKTSYLKNSYYPMTANNKLKYTAVLDSYHFNF